MGYCAAHLYYCLWGNYMTYTGNQVPTPSPNPCQSLQGLGEPDYAPCNYWPYHSWQWYGWNQDPDFDKWIEGREEAMAKTFVPQLARMAVKMNAYIIKHQAKLDQYITDPNAQQALTSCSTCLATLAKYLIRETP